MNISQRYQATKKEVADYCRAVGRDPHEVKVVAVSKTVGIETIGEAVSAGILDFGENRPEMLQEKQREYPQANWHFIGNIQSRKIPGIVSSATLIHSVYQSHHLATINSEAEKREKIQDILAEVNVSGEGSKGGLRPEELAGFLEDAQAFPHLRVRGLMTMAPQGDRLAAAECFRALYHLQQDMQLRFPVEASGLDLRELSMGMSEDWQEAIAAGATMVRIGRAIFDSAFKA